MEQRLIDANELYGIEALLSCAAKTPESKFLIEQVLFDILNMPTVDAVPVVRCGKCKHYRDGRCYRDGYEYDKWESGDTSGSPQNAPVYYGLKATDFCSYGEPRTPPAE